MATKPPIPQSGSGPAQLIAELLIGACSILMLVGIVAGVGDVSPKPDPDPHVRDCAPVIWHDGMDPRGWDMLVEGGYSPRDYSTEHAPIYPPGCEATP